MALIELTRERFEDCIAVGSTMKEIQVLFQKTNDELSNWCMKEYGANFQTVYDVLLQDATQKYITTLKRLGEERGNQTAINIVSQFLINKSAQDKVVKIVFDGSIPEEIDDDEQDYQ